VRTRRPSRAGAPWDVLRLGAAVLALAAPHGPGSAAAQDPDPSPPRDTTSRDTASAGVTAIDTVSVVLGGTDAVVRLRIPNLGERVAALALRVPGQRLEVTGVVREGESLLDATLTEEGDAYRFEVESGAPIVLAYRVSGDLARIPLFVPGGRAELTVAREFEEPFLIRVTGAPERLDEIDTATSLPRLDRVSDGVLEARVSSLPSFLRLSERGPFAFGRVADLLAIAAILLGAAWAWRRLGHRRPGPEA